MYKILAPKEMASLTTRRRYKVQLMRRPLQAVGRCGAIFFSGMLLMAYNTWRTVRAAEPAEAARSHRWAV